MEKGFVVWNFDVLYELGNFVHEIQIQFCKCTGYRKFGKTLYSTIWSQWDVKVPPTLSTSVPLLKNLVITNFSFTDLSETDSLILC